MILCFYTSTTENFYLAAFLKNFLPVALYIRGNLCIFVSSRYFCMEM